MYLLDFFVKVGLECFYVQFVLGLNIGEVFEEDLVIGVDVIFVDNVYYGLYDVCFYCLFFQGVVSEVFIIQIK